MDQPEAGARDLSDEERIDWLRLIRSDNVGPVTFRKLVERYESAAAALEALPELARKGGLRRPLHLADRDLAQREIAVAAKAGCRFVALCEADYPPALRTIDSAPPVIAVKGNAGLLRKTSVAIVGSRNASVSGCKMAATLARGIGEAGYSVISGLARGIDAAAHQAALPTGTVAVLAGGIDRPYPPQNIALLNRICSEGAGVAISEMPFGREPRAQDFPRRNRIIAGTGMGLVVVEAAKRSGSLISARLAGEYGRLVFAVPGSPLDPRSKGTNDLIRDGAILTADADDVISALAPMTGRVLMEPGGFVAERRDIEPPPESDRHRITDMLGPTPVSIDDIVRHCEATAAQVQVVLLELDLAGRLERHPGGAVSLVGGRA